MNPFLVSLGLLWSVHRTRGSSTSPAVVIINEDDYPYQCLCTCSGTRTLGTCDYDSTTPCYCYVPSALAANSTTSF